MPERESGWQQTLVEYVNAVNEEGLNGRGSSFRRVPDPAHRERLARRYEAVARRDRAEAIRPVRSEMRARLLNAAEGPRDAECVLQLHMIRTCEQGRVTWEEERLERERVRLVRTAGGWRIDRIEPLATERSPAALWTDGEEDPEGLWLGGGSGRKAIPSIPYINPVAATAFKSRVLPGPAAGGGGWGEGWYDSPRRGIPYRREEAAAYAEKWWNAPNPAYEAFEVNCTNYVSQCIFAGGAPMNYTGKRDSGWWYKGRSNGQELWSYSWAVANGLQRYLGQPRAFGMRAEAVESPLDLMLGDVICYDWDGNGSFGHNTIVTGFTPEGMPLVNANTVSSRRRYWDYRDSYAWTERTRYRFYHIADEF